MKLTILGTGNASVSECYNTCFAVSEGDRHFLVDAGGGNRILKALNDTGIPLCGIHDIFATHEHVDHVLGIIWLIRVIGQRMNQTGTTGIFLGARLHSLTLPQQKPNSLDLPCSFPTAGNSPAWETSLIMK